MQLPVSPTFRIDGKRALITGGNSGLGLAMATALAAAGAEVTIAARRLHKSRQAAAALTARDLKANALALDVSDTAAGAALIEQHGPFEILVNCAGLARHKPALEETTEDFDAVMDVNSRAAYFLCQAAARSLIAHSLGGSLINVSSQMGKIGGLKRTTYCASKHAVEGFTKALAWEWGEYNIRVNTICPTFIATDFTVKALSDEAFKRSVIDKIALRRLGTVEDVMGAVVFLASDASALITGSALMVDGGWTAV